MNNKTVEGLPLHYLIIILIAVIVIGIVLDIVGVVDFGVTSGLDAINNTVNATLN